MYEVVSTGIYFSRGVQLGLQERYWIAGETLSFRQKVQMAWLWHSKRDWGDRWREREKKP
jgi:hypothetical protein